MAFSSGRGLSINPSSPGGDPIRPVRETKNTQPFLISLYCRLKVKSNCLSSPDPSCISTHQRSTLSITTLKRRAPTVTHKSVCVCVCAGVRVRACVRWGSCSTEAIKQLSQNLYDCWSQSFRLSVHTPCFPSLTTPDSFVRQFQEGKNQTEGTDASSPSFYYFF